jgi:hypothetical protein
MLVVLLAGPLPVGQVLSQMEAARISARAEGPTNTELPWWQGLNVFGGGELSRVVERLVGTNVIGWGNSAENEIQQQNVWRQAGRMHAKGGRYVGGISTFDADYQIYVERPELATTAVIDIYGHPMSVPWESTPEEPLWWGNTNHPLWQSFLLEQARALVDAGVDGIVIDEIEGTAGSIWLGGSFGEPDMSMFRTYLAEVYTLQELLNLFDIEDIETFDYGEYIRDLGLADTWINDQWSVPLYHDFMRFQRLAIVEFMTELMSETRNYVQTTYGRPLAFTANVFGLHPNLLIFADLLDYYTVEYPYMQYGYPPKSQAIPEYKLARALGDKPAVLLAHIETNADLVDRDSSSTLMTLYIAEAYASQGAMLVPYGIYAWSEETGPGWYYGDMSVLAPVYRFVRDNPFVYEGLDSPAQVAVLYSFPTDYHRWNRDAFRGLTYALLDGHVQFDIVALGDDVWLADPFSAASLASYQLVFLPGAAYLSDAQVDSLLSFVGEGGTLVAWGDTGTHDETGREIERPELAALTVPGTHAYGEGWFITLTGDLGDDYRQTHDPAVRQQLVSLVNDYAGRITTASTVRTLNLLTYERVGGTQLVVHLINYDYDIETDHITATGPFTMTLRPPAGFLDQDNIQVYRMSPPHAAPSLLDFTVDDGLLVIDHPGVEIYDALVAMPKADARALANETLDALAEGIAQAAANGYDTSSLDDLLSQIDDAVTAGNHLLSRQLGLKALELLHVLTRPRVLFDEAHAEGNTLSWERALTLEPQHPEWVYFGALAAELEDDFVFERNPDAPLSLELLQDYDALILSAPTETLDLVEREAVNQFVEKGGGLLVLGECGLDHPVNTLTFAYGITFDPHCFFAPVPEREGDFVIKAFADHQATTGVPFMMTNWGESLTVEGSAMALAFTDEDAWQDTNWNSEYDPGEPTGPFTIAAAYEAGRARVAAVADNAFQDDGFEWRSNDLFMRSLLKWLTGWRAPYDYHVYLPLVFRAWGK